MIRGHSGPSPALLRSTGSTLARLAFELVGGPLGPENSLIEAQLAVTAAAVSGDTGGLYGIVSGLLGEGIPFESILFDLLIPAERGVGTRWQQGDYLISEEHAATAAIETVVSLLAGSFDQPQEGPEYVVCAVEGDTHSLPARAIAAHLLFLGHRTTFLGGDLLATDLEEYLQAEKPDALILSSAMTTHLLGARAVVRASHRSGVPVIVGGKGFGESGRWAMEIGADAWAPSLREVAPTLESWEPSVDESEGRARDPSPELSNLIGEKLTVVARAHTLLMADRPPEQAARLLDEVGLLFDSVAAALLVDDIRIVTDMINWQGATLAAQGYRIEGQLIDALSDALHSVSPTGEALLAGLG